MFLCAGLIGLLPVALSFLIREPARHAVAASKVRDYTVGEALRRIWGGRSYYLAFFVGLSMLTVVLYAYQAWIPTFLSRRFGVAVRDIGVQYGALVLTTGCAGVLLGPALGRWLQRAGHQDYALRVSLLCAIGVVPLSVLLPFCPSYASALACAGGVTFLCAMPLAMAASALQLVTPNRIRGLVSSIYMFMISVLGVAIPPTLIALLTDRVFADPAMVGWSLAIVCAVSGVIAAWVIAASLKPFVAALGSSEAA